jgi:hypothetical protein
MNIVSFIFVLIVVGALLYLLRKLPIDEIFKTIIYVIVVIAAIYYVLQSLGMLHGPTIRLR